MKATFVILSASTALFAGQPPQVESGALPVPMITAARQSEEQWRAVEPELFKPDAAKKYLGTDVRCGGRPLSLQDPVTIKLASGTTVRLTKLQGADRDELATFHKPPSMVTVWGPILAVDPKTRTVTIKAVSTAFAPSLHLPGEK